MWNLWLTSKNVIHKLGEICTTALCKISVAKQVIENSDWKIWIVAMNARTASWRPTCSIRYNMDNFLLLLFYMSTQKGKEGKGNSTLSLSPNWVFETLIRLINAGLRLCIVSGLNSTKLSSNGPWSWKAQLRLIGFHA